MWDSSNIFMVFRTSTAVMSGRDIIRIWASQRSISLFPEPREPRARRFMMVLSWKAVCLGKGSQRATRSPDGVEMMTDFSGSGPEMGLPRESYSLLWLDVNDRF